MTDRLTDRPTDCFEYAQLRSYVLTWLALKKRIKQLPKNYSKIFTWTARRQTAPDRKKNRKKKQKKKSKAASYIRYHNDSNISSRTMLTRTASSRSLYCFSFFHICFTHYYYYYYFFFYSILSIFSILRGCAYETFLMYECMCVRCFFF